MTNGFIRNFSPKGSVKIAKRIDSVIRLESLYWMVKDQKRPEMIEFFSNCARRLRLCLIIALFCLPQISLAQNSEVQFEADTVSFNQDTESLLAEGNVILKQPGSTLTADKVIYNQKTDIANAIGNVVLTNADGTVTRSDTMILDNNFTHVIANPLISDFEDGSRLTAREGERFEGVTATFEASNYTPCNCDFDKGERPIWDLRSTRVVHDLKTKTIRHENVRMTIFGLPIFYVPVLAHPDWTVNRRSGFLSPRIRYSKDLGLSVTEPYFQVLSPTQDIEFQPTKFQFRGEGLETIYRQYWDNAELDAHLYTARVETFKKNREDVAAIDAKYTARIGSGWNVESNLRQSSQDTFLRRYGYLSDSYLESNVIATKLKPNRYYIAEISDTQSLKPSAAFNNEPIIAPSIFFEKSQAGFWDDQELKTEISALHIDNEQGYEQVRWNSTISLQEQQALAGGIGGYDVGIMASFFDIKNSPKIAEQNELGRGTAHVAFEWKSPVLLATEKRRIVLEPRAKYTQIFGSDRTDDIPNRDSADFRLDQANMFLTHRYQGLDYVLPGSRADLGLSAITKDAFFGDVTGFVGVSRRLTGKTSTGLNTVPDRNLSDYVASLSIDPPGPLSLSWAGRADSEDYKLNESTTNVSVNYKGTSLTLLHKQLAKAHFTSAQDDLEEATIGLTQNLGAGWKAVASQSYDLSGGKRKQTDSKVSFLWAGGFQDCLTLSLDYKRVPNNDRDIKTSDELQFVLNFKYLGSISQSDVKTASGTN